MLGLSAIASVGIGLFAIVRFYNNDFEMALFDTLIAFFTIGFFFFVFFTRKIKAANFILSIFLLTAVLFAIHLKGEFQVHWVYLVIIAVYYLLLPSIAAKLIAITLGVMSMILYPNTLFVDYLTVLVTTFLMSVFCYVIFKSYLDNQQQLKRLATIDPLTLVGNRRALDHKLSVIIQSQKRQKNVICLLLIDLDYFKHVNDDYGHGVGDEILISLSSLLKNNIRVLDEIYRYGGEEFIVIPQSFDISSAAVLAQKLRKLVEEHNFSQHIKLTISIGVAQLQDNETAEKWISRADSMLYKAKESGRNKVCISKINKH